MLNRRRFLKSIASAASIPALASACHTPVRASRPLVANPGGILDVPGGFELTVVSQVGMTMHDGLKMPPAHDGMAAFAGDDGRIVLVCNHEMVSDRPEYSAFGTGFAELPDAVKERVYDWGGSETPGAGGTTTTVYNPKQRTAERIFLSLAGTELNCAGGPTPWGSWLSCEESFSDPGTSYAGGRRVVREERHGYVFEVPASANGLVEPIPLKEMGRFEHEAAAVDPASGIVYLTEDRQHSCFYRFMPTVPGKLTEGGRLQALAIAGRPAARTHNWSGTPDIGKGTRLPVSWIDLDHVDGAENDLRLRAAADGAATFARCEGLCIAQDKLIFTATIGGPARLGQVFCYTLSPFEGEARELDTPGILELIAESDEQSLLRNADNLTMAPWGDLIVCEDTAEHCGLIGVRSDGGQYLIADNAYSESELAGVCFSPDGRVLFVNIQYPGMTVAITGPWQSLVNA